LFVNSRRGVCEFSRTGRVQTAKIFEARRLVVSLNPRPRVIKKKKRKKNARGAGGAL